MIRWQFLMVTLVTATFLSHPAPASPADACTECHEVLAKPGAHEPALFDCTTCHGTHEQETGRPSNLIKPVNELCLTCHDGRRLGIENGRGHIINNHPLSGHPDRLYPEKELSCASCHNPHSAEMNRLFRYDYKKPPYDGNFCTVCHWDYAHGNGSKPPTPPWDILRRN